MSTEPAAGQLTAAPTLRLFGAAAIGTEFLGGAPRLAPTVEGAGQAAQRLAPELGAKLDYILGNAWGNVHTIERTAEMAAQIERIGLADNLATRQLLADHLTEVLNNPASIAKIQASGRVVRESLLMGPAGGAKIQSVWEGTKLITVNIFGGH